MKVPEMKLGGYNSLFGVSDTRRIITVPLSELHQHPGLHVAVAQDAYLDELTESIKKNGLFEEVRAFPDPDGGYWIISGRHRCEAAKRAGLKEVSVILDDSMTKEAAEIAITDCNLRHELSIMEKAWTYRIKREAESRQGARTDLHGKVDDAPRAKETDSERTIQRYIRLTYLYPGLRALMDQKAKKKLSLRAGAALSYLSEDKQELVKDMILKYGFVPSQEYAEGWRDRERIHQLTKEDIRAGFKMLANQKRAKKAKKVSVNYVSIAPYLPDDFSSKQVQNLIVELLQEWAEERTEK